MRRILLILIVLFFVSCKSSEKKVYVLLKTNNNPFFTEIMDGTIDGTGDLFDLIIKSGKKEDDVETQMHLLQLIIDESSNPSHTVTGVIITPTSSHGELVPYIKKLLDKEIPVILVDTKIDPQYLSKVGIDSIPIISSDNIEGGRQAGKVIVNEKSILKNSHILILNGINGQENAGTRNLGFHQIVDTSFKKLIITERTANWNRDEAMRITASLLSAGKRFSAIFAANDEMALGALQALSNEGISPLPVIVGFDAIEEARKSVASKKMTATIAQNPYRMGFESINLLSKIVKKEKIEYNNTISTEIIK